MDTVSWIAVVVAAISSFVLGGLWYSVLFGNVWAKLAGVSEASQKKNVGLAFGSSFVFAMVAAFSLAMLIGSGATSANGAFYGFLAGLTFAGMALGINDAFERRPIALTLLNVGYHTLSFTLMGAIIGMF